jgi:hypothetical protein
MRGLETRTDIFSSGNDENYQMLSGEINVFEIHLSKL